MQMITMNAIEVDDSRMRSSLMHKLVGNSRDLFALPSVSRRRRTRNFQEVENGVRNRWSH